MPARVGWVPEVRTASSNRNRQKNNVEKLHRKVPESARRAIDQVEIWKRDIRMNERPQNQRPPEEAARAAEVQRLFQEHNRQLVRFLLTRLHDQQDAVEVAQEAYVQLLQLDKAYTGSLLRALLFKIARNLAVDRLRRRRVRQTDPDADPEQLLFGAGMEETYLAGESLQLFWQAVRELPEKPRHALLLNRFHDRTPEEIAEQMGVTARMVRKYVVQALVYCRLRLDGATPDNARAQMRQGQL
jgi:RNA polymerase sigma factor (sigma-70 family)